MPPCPHPEFPPRTGLREDDALLMQRELALLAYSRPVCNRQ
jgi:hypothetical protein